MTAPSVRRDSMASGSDPHEGEARGGWLADLVELAKVRLNLLVLFTVFAGFVMSGSRSLASGADVALLIHALVATFLVACGSSALNHLVERHHDSLMSRTERRPLSVGSWSPGMVRAVGMASCGGGVLYLAACVNLLTAALGAATAWLYLFVYTPLKRRTTLSLFVGAIAGATPPLIGWTAASGTLSAPGWSLFGIIFLWQIPHFLAISWIHRDDYRRAGYRMLTVIEPSGRVAGLQATSYCVLLLPVSLLPAVLRMAGPVYFLSGFVLGLAFLGFTVSFALRRSDASARQLFVASVIYLPLLFTLLLVGA